MVVPGSLQIQYKQKIYKYINNILIYNLNTFYPIINITWDENKYSKFKYVK